PTETKDETNYTFLATNAGGSSEIILVIAVNEPEFTEQINLTYESSDTIRIGLAVSSGLVRLDWNDGSPPVDISNTSIDHIFAYDAPRVHLREGTSTSSAHAVTLSFTDGVD